MARTKQAARKTRNAPRMSIPPRKPLELFIDRLLGTGEGLELPNSYEPRYQAKFQLASRQTYSATFSEKLFSSETIKSIICREEVLPYLAPHELLSLWRTCRACQISSLRRRQTLMLQSVFRYLRISEEAAQFVQETYLGGWRAFLPRLVSLCEYLATKVYGELEPDIAHRVYLAEQVCFYGSRSHGFRMGKLASHETMYQRETAWGPGRWAYIPEDEEEEEEESLPVPPLQDLLRVQSRQIAWGHPEFSAYYDSNLPAWLEEHRQWMQQEVVKLEAGENEEYNEHKVSSMARISEGENAAKKPRKQSTRLDDLARNEHLRNRIRRGFHPAIWLSFDNGAEVQETYVMVGPQLEQSIGAFSSYYTLSDSQYERENQKASFFTCFPPEWRTTDFPGGIVGYLIGSPCSPESFNDRQITLGMCIWCKRHQIPPFDNPSIDWESLIDEAKTSEANNQFSYFGNSEFYKAALTSPEFGFAHVNKYMDVL